MKILEAFSGIGAQVEALSNANIKYELANTIEWEVSAMYAYDILHNGPQDLKQYRFHTKNSLVETLSQYNLSTDGKSPTTNGGLASLSVLQLKSILHAIESTNNLVDINQVNALDIKDDIDIFTYSFPCQDLSIMSHLWKNDKGINRESKGRSSLLWEVERILFDFHESEKYMPRFLVMENVSAILSKKHYKNFNMWCESLNKLGYYNKVYTLTADNFGIPQSRQRTYMISVYIGDSYELEGLLDDYFFENNLESLKKELNPLEDYLRLDYSNKVYYEEAKLAIPNFTPSRERIFKNNLHLAIDSKASENLVAKTITTKQDRNPNSGIIKFTEKNKWFGKEKYRNLTPREVFLLMGFSEQRFDDLIENDRSVKLLTDTKLHKLAGNSIVVPVLEEVFKQIEQIDYIISNRLAN